MYYEIYVNKTGTDTPGSFMGIINVLDDDGDILADKWCEKTLGPKYKLHNHDLKEAWRYIQVSEDSIHGVNLISTIKRKTG